MKGTIDLDRVPWYNCRYALAKLLEKVQACRLAARGVLIGVLFTLHTIVQAGGWNSNPSAL